MYRKNAMHAKFKDSTTVRGRLTNPDESASTLINRGNPEDSYRDLVLEGDKILYCRLANGKEKGKKEKEKDERWGEEHEF